MAPWLAEAVHTGSNRLRHGPDGADATQQRSCLVAPLVAAQGPLGCLYADIEGAAGRFEEPQRALLALLAAQAATALETCGAAPICRLSRVAPAPMPSGAPPSWP